MGCFWGAERKFWQAAGVYSTAVGYAGGYTPNPTYREVCSGMTGHTEVVLVVFDQLRGDYLTRWEPLFGDGGFRRLQKEGAWYQNCHYSYAATLTGAGHATLLTGCNPAKHGIVGPGTGNGSFFNSCPDGEKQLTHPAEGPADQ